MIKNEKNKKCGRTLKGKVVFMRVETKPTMKWEDAPDTITPNDLAAILGIGIGGARAIFDKDDFPKISKRDIGNIGKADKEAARLYIQGVNIKKHN